MSRYLIDTNLFIEAKNRFYGLDFCPAFWDWLVQQGNLGRVASVARVKDELDSGRDELSEWVKNLRSDFFISPDDSSQEVLAQIKDWVDKEKYIQHAKDEFFDGADPWLVAQAKSLQCTVVTLEIKGSSSKKVKIPNVCGGLNVDCIDPFKMLRCVGARFVLPSDQT